LARSRNIKPSFFKNEYLAEMDPHARLLFIGLWCLADREGCLEDRPKRIKGELFPYEDVDVDKLLQVLHIGNFIWRYEVDGHKYIWIPKFLEHQNPHKKEAASVIPKPDKSIGNSGASNNLGCGQDEPKHERAGLIPDSLNLIPDSLNLIADTVNPEPGKELSTAASENPFLFYQQNFGVVSPYINENIQKWTEDLSDVAVVEAMKIAIESNVKNWRFISKILNDWHAKGIKTLDQIKAERLEHETKSKRKTVAPVISLADKLPASVQRQLELEKQNGATKPKEPRKTIMDDPELRQLYLELRGYRPQKGDHGERGDDPEKHRAVVHEKVT